MYDFDKYNEVVGKLENCAHDIYDIFDMYNMVEYPVLEEHDNVFNDITCRLAILILEFNS